MTANDLDYPETTLTFGNVSNLYTHRFITRVMRSNIHPTRTDGHGGWMKEGQRTEGPRTDGWMDGHSRLDKDVREWDGRTWLNRHGQMDVRQTDGNGRSNGRTKDGTEEGRGLTETDDWTDEVGHGRTRIDTDGRRADRLTVRAIGRTVTDRSTNGGSDTDGR